MLSIQAFSQKTGIPKSALRFYEEKGLLIPERNRVNGYRLYREEQIELAMLISSLRLADVSLQNIQQYISATRCEQEQMKETWLLAMKEKRRLLDVQIKYLESEPNHHEIFLFEKQPERILWLFAEESQGRFAKFFLKGQKELETHRITVHNYYLKYMSGRKSVKAWIGIGIDESSPIIDLPIFEQEETIGKSLCVATKYQGDFSKIETAYRKIVRYVSEHHYIPTGTMMEMYQGNDLNQVVILIPVMEMGGEEIETNVIR